ncbi:MAG: hypothetical protein DMF84_29520 [Acidobacteria bacterium]|nr:MAG: hypothetical protein DMF84_29520 [Acidobacteriota bacterium]
MAARPTWKGFLKISLVNIPVRVFPATDSAATISFNQLHGECQTRIQQKRWCPKCEREVPISEVVKGYEFEKGRYVVMDEEDLAKVRPVHRGGGDRSHLRGAAVLSRTRRADGARSIRRHSRRDERESRHREARALRARVPRRRAAAREGPRDVHDAALQ